MITNWLIVTSGYSFFILLRRWTILALWKFKDDPHQQEMIINGLFFITFLLFEVCWHIFLNTFVWFYIFSSLKAIDLLE
tara:strand:- start:438 stop:674 length:237 start_codon:yes stop_codon:yes gene_type:complete